MKMRALAWMTGAALALPQMVAACAQLSEAVWMCDRGTAWEAAQWDQFGDGATRLLGDFVLDFNDQWPGHDITDAAATLEEQYATYAEWTAADVAVQPDVLHIDTLESPYAKALRHIQRDVWEGEPYLQTVMLAQVGRARIMLWLQGPDGMPVEQMDAASSEIVSMLRDSCADAISCAEDYMPPQTAQKE